MESTCSCDYVSGACSVCIEEELDRQMGHPPPKPIRRRTKIETAQIEFTRGNIDVFELERRVARALEHEPTDKIMLESTPEKESTMVAVRRVGGIIALGTAAFIALFMIAIVAFGIGGLIVHLLSM